MTKKERAASIFLCIVCLLAVGFAVLRPKLAAEAAFSALTLCVTRVVPSLFLFMVAAKILAAAGFASLFSRMSHGVLERLFGVSPYGAAVILLGLLSGYPTGAVVAGEYLAAGKMERAEAERILPFATAASPAFLVGAVGGMFGDRRFGAVLLAAQLLSVLALLLLTRGKGGAVTPPEAAERKSTLAVLASAIKSSGHASLAVCSFVTFFYVFSAMILHVFPLPARAAALLSGAMEISCGFSRLAGCGVYYFLGGTMLGFGGFSVLLQTADALGEAGVSMGKYLRGKCVQALICGALASLLGKAFSDAEGVATALFFGREQARVAAMWEMALTFSVICLFSASVLVIFLKIKRKNSKK